MMMKKILLTGAALFGLATAANAVVLFTDNFEGNTNGTGVTPVNWTVTGGSVDVVSTFGAQGHQIDMDGASLNTAVIETNAGFNILAGNTYKIDFDYGTKSPNFEIMTVQLGSFGAGVLNFTGAMASLVHASFTFLATSNFPAAKLMFSGFVGTSNGMLLDNVSLEQLSPIPLPPGALLFGTGLFGLGALARHRKV
jgi:hypothetical protein